MKKIAFIALSVFIAFAAHAQNSEKRNVGVAPLEYENSSYRTSAEELHELIVKAFSENKNILLLDRSKVQQLQQEAKLQQNKEYVGGKTAKQNKANGAEWLVIGKLTNISNEKTSSTGQNISLQKGKSGGTSTTTTNSITISFSLQMTDVATGEVLDHNVFNVTKSVDVSGKSTSNFSPVNACQDKIMTKVDGWINKVFPQSFKITSIDERTNSGYPKMVSLVCDQSLNVKKNNIIDINEVTKVDIDGVTKTRVVKIASLQVKEIEGDFIKCLVKSGNEDIEEKMKKNKRNLRLQLAEKQESGGLLGKFKEKFE